jgi:predicted ester cyclase
MASDAENRESARAALRALAESGDPAPAYRPDATWHGSHPFNEISGLAAIAAVWRQLRTALPDLERRDALVVSGASRDDPRAPGFAGGRPLVAIVGHYQGTFRADLCGIPATGGVVHLRVCEVHELAGERIARSWVLLDLLDLMRQAGVWPIAPSLGAEHLWPGPNAGDGLAPAGGPEAAEAGFAAVMAMHAALGQFDGRRIASIPIEPYWTDRFMWYGPSGIGSTRGLAGFRAHHQIPFLVGFNDRKGAGHFVRIAEGDYVVTGGWPSVVGTHTGAWLGLPPTGRRIEMRVMDFYRMENGLIAENWVPIDVIHMLLQMGFDVLGRLRHLRGDQAVELPAAAP